VARPTLRTCHEAAELLCRLLDAVEKGELDASSSDGADDAEAGRGAFLTLDEIARLNCRFP
jgi:hypothetical protein